MSQSNYNKFQDVIKHLRKARVILAGVDFEDSDTGKSVWRSVSSAHEYCNQILRKLEEGRIR